MELDQFEGFEWDSGNKTKNYKKHKVSNIECEQVFFNRPLIIEVDVKHSAIEDRFYVLGQTDKSRKLFIAFTVRDKLIRIISARDMIKSEREFYGQKRNT